MKQETEYVNLLLKALDQTKEERLPEERRQVPSWLNKVGIQYYSIGIVVNDNKGHANSISEQSDIVCEFINREKDNNKWISFDDLLYQAFVCRFYEMWFPNHEEAKWRYPEEVQNKAKEIIKVQSN